MAIKKLPDGRYQLSFRPYGYKGKHIRRIFKTRSAALRFERDYLLDDSKQDDSLKLLDLANLWFDYYGCNLKDGKKRYSKLVYLIGLLGNHSLDSLRPAHYLEFRKHRLDAGISPNTCNHDLSYFKSVFNSLMKASIISKNPFLFISPLSIDQPELNYLTRYQLRRLLVACRQSRNESLLPVALLCVRTGCRWSEAETLTARQLRNYSVTFLKTKNGKNRTIPLNKEFYTYLKSRPELPSGRIFANCYSAFRLAVRRSKIYLPPGQCSHILRHTFASHFVQQGGNILTLQKILDHSDLKVTMIYSHLAPDHLVDVLKFQAL